MRMGCPVLRLSFALLTLAGMHGMGYAQQPAAKPLLARDVQWMPPFGIRKTQPDTIYCLMASGFFRAPTTADFKAKVAQWLAKHPDARVTPVWRMGSISTSDPKATQTSVWVTDGAGPSLNLYLVQQGICPGGTMVVMESASAKSSARLISKAEYKRFLAKVLAAENAARRAKRGIWRKGGEAEQD